MFLYNFKYELKQLLRSKWIQLLSILLLIVFAFAIKNGNDKVARIEKDVFSALNEQKETDAMMLKLLDSIEQGLSVSANRWTIPSNPMAVANYHPRVVAKQPQPLAFVATGQSDLFTHYVKPTAAGDDLALNFTEMTSPVQLLFGSFDIAFVIVYLLPLIIIAFSYNVLSSERESGSLKLLASQPIKLQTWLLQKLGLRFFWLFVVVLLTLTILMFAFGFNPFKQLSIFLSLISLVLVYMLFWFGLAFVVNIWIGNSAKNAVSLLGFWIFFVLLAPSVLNQISSTLYPMPSRNIMINNMRTLKAEVTEKQDEILDNYLRDHPEYAINDSTQARNFYHRYMASQKLLKEELIPEVNRFEAQLQNQQDWLDTFKWISPAIIVQESLNKMAGSSAQDYEDFRKQVVVFSDTWRNHFMPLLYNNKTFTKKDYQDIPVFEFHSNTEVSSSTLLVLFVISIGIFSLGFIASKGFERSKVLIQS